MSLMPRRAVLAGALALALMPLATTADDHPGMGLKVEQPWARATPGNAPNGAAYLRVVNHGREMDRLVGATSPVSRKVE
ncbi:MAG TPA: copper chaperone PCu(A)C, partial [Pseudohaliea sp.]|nr:copper chaperone PCu(A)C [Pseudohaliea sp.]